jgi:hypothetical protein
MLKRVGSLAAMVALLSLGTAYAGKLSERTSAAAANVGASVDGSASIGESDSGISAGVATGGGGSGVGSGVSDRANTATADTGSGAEPSSPAGPTPMTVDIDAARSLTIEDFANLTDEQREEVRKFLSKRQLRRLARGCSHAGLDAELRGTCAYLSDYLR